MGTWGHLGFCLFIFQNEYSGCCCWCVPVGVCVWVGGWVFVLDCCKMISRDSPSPHPPHPPTPTFFLFFFFLFFFTSSELYFKKYYVFVFFSCYFAKVFQLKSTGFYLKRRPLVSHSIFLRLFFFLSFFSFSSVPSVSSVSDHSFFFQFRLTVSTRPQKLTLCFRLLPSPPPK